MFVGGIQTTSSPLRILCLQIPHLPGKLAVKLLMIRFLGALRDVVIALLFQIPKYAHWMVIWIFGVQNRWDMEVGTIHIDFPFHLCHFIWEALDKQGMDFLHFLFVHFTHEAQS